MQQTIMYKSTRNSDLRVTSSQAILQGLAPDGGLYVPETIPAYDGNWEELSKMRYKETARRVMRLLLTDYTEDELQTIVLRSAHGLGVEINEQGALESAKRSRGTPRLANRLLKRTRDYAQVMHDGRITDEAAREALDFLDVDPMGLDNLDREILSTMIGKFQGGPVGLDTLAAAIGEDSGTIEDVYEPYLIKNGFLVRTPKGRAVTDHAYLHLGLTLPERAGV